MRFFRQRDANMRASRSPVPGATAQGTRSHTSPYQWRIQLRVPMSFCLGRPHEAVRLPAVRLAEEARRLATDLQASRERLVLAREEEPGRFGKR